MFHGNHSVLHRALNQQSHCLEAIRIEILHLLVREGNYDEAAVKLGELIQIMDRFEPKNPQLYCEVSQAFCRVVSTNFGGLKSLKIDNRVGL